MVSFTSNSIIMFPFPLPMDHEFIGKEWENIEQEINEFDEEIDKELREANEEIEIENIIAHNSETQLKEIEEVKQPNGKEEVKYFVFIKNP